MYYSEMPRCSTITAVVVVGINDGAIYAITDFPEHALLR